MALRGHPPSISLPVSHLTLQTSRAVLASSRQEASATFLTSLPVGVCWLYWALPACSSLIPSALSTLTVCMFGVVDNYVCVCVCVRVHVCVRGNSV